MLLRRYHKKPKEVIKETPPEKQQEAPPEATEGLDTKETAKEIPAIDDITKDQIIAKLEARGVDHRPKDRKEILYRLLTEGE